MARLASKPVCLPAVKRSIADRRCPLSSRRRTISASVAAISGSETRPSDFDKAPANANNGSMKPWPIEGGRMRATAVS
jgi:hypothetical protein